jgi:hypothetical protein
MGYNDVRSRPMTMYDSQEGGSPPSRLGTLGKIRGACRLGMAARSARLGT